MTRCHGPSGADFKRGRVVRASWLWSMLVCLAFGATPAVAQQPNVPFEWNQDRTRTVLEKLLPEVCAVAGRCLDKPPPVVVGAKPQLEARAAPVVEGGDWSVAAGPGDPDRAEAWQRMACAEHASIASFARLTLQLLALGAPADLLADVQQAALDEVEHARLAFGMASRFAGRAVQPGPFPLPRDVVGSLDLADLAEAAVREGCLGETVGAFLARERCGSLTDPTERAVLERVVKDETRHAGLSWRLVAWLMAEGGEPVRARVQAAFAEPFAVHDPLGPVAAEVCDRVYREVLVPAHRALMAA